MILCDITMTFHVITLAASSGKRNVTAWRISVRISVCPSVCPLFPNSNRARSTHRPTQRDSPGGSTRCDQHTFRPSIKSSLSALSPTSLDRTCHPHGRYPAAEASVLQSARARHTLPRWAAIKIQERAEVQSEGM